MNKKFKISILLILLLILATGSLTYAETDFSLFGKNINITDANDPADYVSSIQLLVILQSLRLHHQYL